MANPIDLRSDTVTRPTDGMRAAMAAAPVGDDQYGEDITTNQLQARCAELLDKEAALWLPTGTMANQVAVRTLTRPGDEVVASRESHLGWHEVGGAAANAGVQVVEVGRGGVFTAEDLRAAAKPKNFPIFPTATLVTIENTHNRAGGVVVPQAEVLRICAAARELGMATFLDGARLWNASVASGIALAELAAPFDLVAVAFSKGLGAPGGSLLAGSKALIASAHRHRHRMGGAMRQNGIFGASALYALDHHLQRLAEDHANARAFAASAEGRGTGGARSRHRADQHRGVPAAGGAVGRCADAERAGARARRAGQCDGPAHRARGDAPRREPRAVRGGCGRPGPTADRLTLPIERLRHLHRDARRLVDRPTDRQRASERLVQRHQG